jgi:eukaryotic-like serine/threonine-protein kinase
MKDTLAGSVRFGKFDVDLRAGELREGGRKVVLQDQPFRVLRILVEHDGGIVTREEIQKKLWPNDTIVEFDHGINTAIKKLRVALGDSAENPKYIETVARHGYRLMIPVQRMQSSGGDRPPSGETFGSGSGTAVRPQLETASLTGKTVSHYRVLQIVGGGGMGVVYRAEDVRLGRAVALKFLPEDVSNDPRALERFEREARAASALDHPNLCSIYEFGEHEGQPFIVMQLLQGQTLRDRLALARDGPRQAARLALDQLLLFAIQITNGLEAAHEKGIIHRDIKPANIFITDKGIAKILDFGLAKLTEATDKKGHALEVETQSELESPTNKSSEALNLSRPGVVFGTAAYMSPEQVRGENLDARTDLFSFGLILYEMATGQTAFRGTNVETLQDAILGSSPTPALQLNPDLPPRLEAIIDKCLQRNRDLRYQRAAAIRDDLEKVKQETENPLRRRWKPLATVAVVVFVLFAGGLYWRSRKVSTVTEKDTIVLADFDNRSGDAVLDSDTLNTALAMQLERSHLLNVLSDEKVSATLKLMNSPDARLTKEVAHEVCQRNDGRALLTGSIGAVGEHYLIDLKAVNCRTGEALASASAEAENRNEVLKKVKQVANQVREQLGESLAPVEKSDKPLEEVTTASLEALQAFSRARRVQMTGEADPIPYLQRALEMDPIFAAAYALLGAEYENKGQSTLAISNYRKAYELRDRVSPRERLNIEGHYYDDVTGEKEKAIQSYRELSLTDPGDRKPHQNLSAMYAQLGQYDKAVEEARETIRLVPDNVGPYATLMLSYNALNQCEKAKAAFDGARSRKLDHPFLRVYRYQTAFLQGDDAVMQEEASWAMGKPGAEDLLLSTQSDTEAYRGRFEKARQFSRRAVESARRADEPETAAAWKANEALREAEIGDRARALQTAAEAMALMPGRDVRVATALTFARTGKATQAHKLIDQLDREFPLDTIMQGYWLPTMRAAIELDNNNPAKAIEILQLADPYQLAGVSSGYLYPVYVRGEAYLKAGQSKQAAAEFQKLLDHPGIVLNFVTGALAHLQLGRAQAMMGDKEAARKSYQEFFELWKDSDPDLPILKAARVEYEGLK